MLLVLTLGYSAASVPISVLLLLKWCYSALDHVLVAVGN